MVSMSKTGLSSSEPNRIAEREVRNVLKEMNSSELRTGCEVLSREEEEGFITVEYKTHEGQMKSIRTSWLVGADGKRGIVRKKWLEPEGIKQESGLYDYKGTWVAANLKVTLPTPDSHPKFPLWALGYTPEQVHKVFWPSGFHFCNNTKRPAVSGRFGPKGATFWRHEYCVEQDDNLEDPLEHFWEQFGPWMVRAGSAFSRRLRGTFVEFPTDCIEVMRCRPFQFASTVVNRWFCRKTLLIGDAAHVFPPFGGQGIATGIRDAQSLGWRLALMSRLQVNETIRERILKGWAQERRNACDAATLATKYNGAITNERSLIRSFFHRWFMRILWWIPGVSFRLSRSMFRDLFRYRNCPEGFFLPDSGGGKRIAQIWLWKNREGPRLSDGILFRDPSRVALVVIVREPKDFDSAQVEATLKAAALPDSIMTAADITYLPTSRSVSSSEEVERSYYPCAAVDLLRQGITPVEGYEETALHERLGSSAKYLIVRPDCFIHSIAADLDRLATDLEAVREYFCDE